VQTTLHQFSCPLGKYTSIFQAEVFAISKIAVYLNSKGTKERNITVYSDSKAALQALKRTDTQSALVACCHGEIAQLADKNKVTLVWIPAHQGFEGNEKADQLAKNSISLDATGSRLRPFTGPEPCFPVPISLKLSAIREWEHELHTKRWRKTTGNRHTKELIKLPWTGNKSIITLPRCKAKWRAYIYTGHGPWNVSFDRQLNCLQNSFLILRISKKIIFGFKILKFSDLR